MGGIIAFEMARQLHALRQRVSFLALIDAQAPPPRPSAAEKDDALLLSEFALSVGPSSSRFQVSLDELRRLDPEQQLALVLQKAREAHLVTPDIGPAQVGHLLRVYKSNARALGAYAPQKYAGRVAVFKAAARASGGRDDPAMGWGRLAEGGAEARTTPGGHFTLLKEPHVGALAESLRACMCAAELRAD